MCLYFKVRPYDFRWFYFTMKKQSSFPMLQPSLQHSPVNAIKLTLPIMVSLIQHLLRWAIQELSVTVQHVQYSHPHGTGGRWSGNTVPLTTSPTSVSSRASSRAVRRTQQFVLASRAPQELSRPWGGWAGVGNLCQCSSAATQSGLSYSPSWGSDFITEEF